MPIEHSAVLSTAQAPSPPTLHFAVHPAVLTDPGRPWRPMLRIEAAGGDVCDVIKWANDLLPERMVYAEGDSWFDKFTPLPKQGTNLLDTIRTPYLTAVVDVAHVGDEARDMVRGHQARQTRAMFDLFGFQAILLSAGGNDLKNVFADLFAARALADAGLASPFQPRGLERLDAPSSYTAFFADVMRHIGRFVDLRDASREEPTRSAPIFVHGYDYLQPRPASARVFAGSRIGAGPWLHPSMKAAGLSDMQMRAAADAVVDEMNRQLRCVIAPLPNVHVIDQRGLLTPATPGASGPEGDWLDEIHPSKEGFTRLARHRWDVPLAEALGWRFAPDELVPAALPLNRSTAPADVAPVTIP